jgi:hypothetical protein
MRRLVIYHPNFPDVIWKNRIVLKTVIYSREWSFLHEFIENL